MFTELSEGTFIHFSLILYYFNRVLSRIIVKDVADEVL